MKSALTLRNRRKACISDSSPPSKLPLKLCTLIENLPARNKEKAERDVLYQQLPFDALRYIKEENVESIFGNPEIEHPISILLCYIIVVILLCLFL